MCQCTDISRPMILYPASKGMLAAANSCSTLKLLLRCIIIVEMPCSSFLHILPLSAAASMPSDIDFVTAPQCCCAMCWALPVVGPGGCSQLLSRSHGEQCQSNHDATCRADISNRPVAGVYVMISSCCAAAAAAAPQAPWQTGCDNTWTRACALPPKGRH